MYCLKPNSLKGILSILQYVKQYPPLKIIQKIYTSLFEPYFRYYSPVCGCEGTTTLQKLRKLQNRVARVTKNSCFYASSNPLT